jgi:hypothetical protein
MGQKRYLHEPKAIKIEIKNILQTLNKDYSDIEDISLNFKKETATDLDDAYLEKKLSSGGVYLDQARETIYMHLNTQLVGSKIVPSNGDDYLNLTLGTYFLCGAIKLVGITRLVELQFLDTQREIEITADTNRA